LNKFFNWDEVGGESEPYSLPDEIWEAAKVLPPAQLLDLADVTRAGGIEGVEVGYSRSHYALSNGAHLLTALFGRDRQYGVAWHPTDEKAARDTIEALNMAGEADEEAMALLPLSREIEKLLNETAQGEAG
jgi:hypothetical protein